MATTTNNSVSPIPLRPKRGIDSNTKNRLERVSKKNLDGDTELSRGLYSIVQTFTVRPGKVFKDEKFPTFVFILMIIIDILDIIVGFSDATGIGWIVRIIILQIIPIIIIIFWTKGEGKKFKKDLDSGIDRLLSFVDRAQKYTDKMARRGEVKAGKKVLGKEIRAAIAKRSRSVIMKKAFWRIFRLFLVGLVPLLTFFGLWSYFVYAFYVSKVEEKNKLQKSINEMYIMHANQANQANQAQLD